MSRILRRPMFRGGKVIDSRGTGITSGLMDGGRVGYQTGDLVLGRDLYSPQDFSSFMIGYKDQLPPALKQQVYNKDGTIKEDFTYENIFEQDDKEGKPQSVFDSDIFKFSDVGIEGSKSKRITSPGKKDFANALKTDVLSKMEESGAYSYDDMPQGGGADQSQMNLKKDDDNDTTGNRTIEPVVSPEDAIRENAELFKELLGEASKEDIKKARIQDASDYLLKFFAGTQKEGADVGSAAAEVAEFAVSRDSRTDRAKEAAKKTDQTATALAINDYIAGKRSKEEINKLLAGYAAKAEFAKGDTASQIADFAGKQGYLPGVDIIKTYIRDDKALSGKEIVEFDSTKQSVEYSPGDENRVYIDTNTKQVFTFNKDKIRIPISG